MEALLEAPQFEILCVFVERDRHPEVVARVAELECPLQVLEGDKLREEAGYDFHRGVLAQVRRPAPQDPDEALLRSWDRIVFPVGLADPGNLGTVVRNAAAFGASAVLIERGRGADIWNRKTIRASATAIFRIPIFEVSSVIGSIEMAKTAGFIPFGTSLSGQARSLEEAEIAKKSLLLFGSERDGLPLEYEEMCNELIRIPMSQGMDSLNVASTAAIICHHFFLKH